MPEIRFATAKIHPGLHEDDHPLLDELSRRGVSYDCAIWDDPAVDWGAAKVTMIRSTWDYHRRRGEYVAWAKRAAAKTSFWNPAPIVEWNTDKRYLRELEQAGIPIVPTLWVERGTRLDVARTAAERGWDAIVLKPVVGAGAFGAMKAERGDLGKAQEHLDRLLAAEDVMVQPYLRTVEGHGERSMLFLGGELSHSVRKQPAFRPQTAEADPARSSDAEAAAARTVLAAVAKKFPVEGRDLLYARVDLLPDENGVYRVMELELTEPTLFFREGGAAAVNRVADGLVRRLGRR